MESLRRDSDSDSDYESDDMPELVESSVRPESEIMDLIVPRRRHQVSFLEVPDELVEVSVSRGVHFKKLMTPCLSLIGGLLGPVGPQNLSHFSLK